jgi:ABC-2 type transport system permease protein
MRAALAAEFRKIFSTRLWWVLLVAGGPIAALVTWVTSLIGWALNRELHIGAVPTALIGFARGTNLATTFAVVLGVCAVSGEYRSRSIAISFLTSTRNQVLGAKLLGYGAMGALYGLVVVGCVTLGGWASGAENFPSAGRWLWMCAAGVLAMTLWTLLGVGLGTLVTNPWVAVPSALGYVLLVETWVVNQALQAVGAAQVAAYLPNTAGTGMLSDLATSLFFAQVNERGGSTGIDMATVLAATGGSTTTISNTVYSVASWPVSTLVFLGWTAALVGAGWWTTLRRDLVC